MNTNEMQVEEPSELDIETQFNRVDAALDRILGPRNFLLGVPPPPGQTENTITAILDDVRKFGELATKAADLEAQPDDDLRAAEALRLLEARLWLVLGAKPQVDLVPCANCNTAGLIMELTEAGGIRRTCPACNGLGKHQINPAAPLPATVEPGQPEEVKVYGTQQMACYPEKCPITRRPFFMVIDHPTMGAVPTYGGPYDSYTIPVMQGESDQQMHQRELDVEHFDHDRGHWVETETIPLRVIHDDFLPDDEPPTVPFLAKKHTGMRVDYNGLLGQCQRALAHGHSANAEMLRQLQGHLKELGQRWYVGDVAVVDEILQLYCIEKDARDAIATQPAVPEELSRAMEGPRGAPIARPEHVSQP
ncbi:MAG: hypothetical protein V4614_15185 [Pseudomonadota bacterium]